MTFSDRTGKRAAFGAVLAAVLCAVPPVLAIIFGVGILAYVPPWLDFILVPLFVVLLAIAGFRWWKGRVSKRLAG
ncbi:MAG: hypothetical protein NXH87_15950 [Rhodobiaceae bacterium]|nr:hypothetical protein RHODOSMS8_02518 [Rhodobiaceae bacterium]MCR9242873.1 hypothetical protein [Rhodobiaceae bacterium]